MANCCSPSTGFPNAATMSQLSTNYPVIWEEICMIQQAILAASSQCQPGGGQMCTTIAGTTPMTFVTGVLSVTVNDGGNGYYTDTPTVYFEPPNGAGSITTATGTVSTNGTNITGITITDGGLGYQPIPSTLSVSSLSGNGASIEPLVNSYGEIIGINIIDGGQSYTMDDSVTATRAVPPNAAYMDAVFKIATISVTGQILSVAIMNPGTGYQPSVTIPKIVSSLDNGLDYPTGTGFYGLVTTDDNGTITGVQIINRGAGYAPYPPYLVINDPGTGAQTTVNLTNASVNTITVNNPGNNYTQDATGDVLNPPTAPDDEGFQAADVTINVAENTFGTDPTLYWQVWTGVTTNKPIQLQLTAVQSYFQNLGYTVTIQTNPNTANTIQWKICW